MSGGATNRGHAGRDSARPAAVQASDFVHLHNHTQYSLLDGLTKVPDLIRRVKELGMRAVAMTDHGTLSGAIEFYKEAKAAGIKPIIGLEAYVAARRLSDKDAARDKTSYHLTILAMNNRGYQNLMRLSTVANLDGFYYKPRIDRELLREHSEGLIVLSGCIGGEVGEALRQGSYDQAKAIAEWYRAVFGERYYLEIQDHGHPEHPSAWREQVDVTQQTFRLARELGIECVVTCDAHYLTREDQDAHEILLCVQTGSFLADKDRMSLKDFQLHVTDPREVIDRWASVAPELITNTRKIADLCDVEIELGKYLIPQFPVPPGETEKSYLDLLTYQGLIKRYAPKAAVRGTLAELKRRLPKAVAARARFELEVIDRMGFNGYFLIVQDFINWGKGQGIVFGPGRGSGAGSIVAYGLRITEIDPLEYQLLFERFLNPDRVSLPDFDVDIQDTRRGEVIRYCIDKYGPDRVANIVTFGRMAARNAVRDVARVLQVPYAEADRLAKMIPPPTQGRHVPLAVSIKKNQELAREYAANQTTRRVFDLAIQLEGTIRSHGVHAAGVVIAPDDIVKFVPLEMAQKGVVATQYPMGPIEDIGLLKMDFLGLSNLTIIKNALRIIRKVYGRNLDINRVTLADAKTYELLARGDTTGVFQLESAGMKRYLKELKPNRFADIIAMVALYRPGPMAEVPRFIEGKNNPAGVSYPHSALEPILQETYGVIVFQEQIIALLQLIAGYQPGEADLVRKAIGKKKRDIMRAEEPRFVEGCLKQGLTRKDAQKLWALIQPFADYSFNKAHAACYALIAYQTAYLKANYPIAFMAALMTSDYGDTDRLAVEIAECKHMGIEVLPPDINESFVEFAVVPNKNQIRFSLAAIKNVGVGAVEEILRARESGQFVSIEDFMSRVSARLANRKVIECLIKAGAFDRFGDRGVLLANLDALMAYAVRAQKQADSGQTDLFGGAPAATAAPKIALAAAEATDRRAILAWERELLGLCLSRHPLEEFEPLLAEQTMPLSSITGSGENQAVVVGGAVTGAREITAKNGRKMAFVKIEDRFGEAELVIFPDVFQQTVDLWERDRVVIVNGKVTIDRRAGQAGEEAKILVNAAREVAPDQTGASDLTAAPPRRVYVKLANSADQALLLNLKSIIEDNSGDTEVVLVLGEGEGRQIIRLPMKITPAAASLRQLAQLVGPTNVKID